MNSDILEEKNFSCTREQQWGVFKGLFSGLHTFCLSIPGLEFVLLKGRIILLPACKALLSGSSLSYCICVR